MPRTKESDDESEIKTGRRSRAISGTNVTDSPLRRSTRNRQQVNRELSPDGVSSGPVTRTTRRKAASQEVFTSESVRTLRSRKTSFTSDTSENHDQETADTKRITRKSTTATSDTPTSIRLRRSVRAGSESKTIQSPAKTNRFTRASSLDLEERDNESNLQVVHNSTPIKIRRRASILPSEPVLIEEIEKDNNSLQESLQSIIEHDPKEKEANDTEDKRNTVNDFIKEIDFNKSPILRLSRGFTPDVEVNTNQSNENVNDGLASPFKSSSVSSLKSISEEINDSDSKEESTIFNNNKNQIIDIIQTPKVVVEKMKFPLDVNTSKSFNISPNNKENEKSNVTIPMKKFQFLKSDEAPTQRKSLITTASEKISIVKRLNKSIDDKILVTNESSSNESLSTSKKPSEVLSDFKVIDENVFSVSLDSKDESIIITEEIKKSDNDVNNSDNTIIPQEQSLKDASLNVSINDNLETDENNVVEKSLHQDNEISMMDIDETETNNSKEELQNTNEPSNVTSPSIELQKVSNGDEPSRVQINEASSIVDESETNKVEQEIIMESNFEDELPVNTATSPSKTVEENDKESNKSVDDESEYDLNQLFKDIPAEEWNEESPTQLRENDTLKEKDLNIQTKKVEDTISDDKKEKNYEKGSTEDFELVLVDKKAWEAAEAERLKKIRDVYSFGSEDSIQTDGSFQKSIEPPASPPFEEPMEIDDNEVENEAEQISEKGENTSLNSSQDQLNTNKQVLNENNDKIEKVHENKDTLTLNKSDNLEKEVKYKQITPIKIGPVTSSKKVLTKDNNLPRQSLDSLLNQNKTLKTSPLKTRKSLNPSMKLDIITQDNKKENKIETPLKSSKNSTDESLNNSELENTDEMNTVEDKELNKELPTKSPKEINKSLNQSVSKKTEDKLKNTPHKETKVENHISPVNLDSDMQSTDSENESDEPDIILPAFLLGESSDSSDELENDSSSTDSDIAREYNLNGDSVLEYSDDNVPGDICHASETESSESDEEDDDLADFIVDDDEEIEEEESESENESGSENDAENEISNKENESNEDTQDDDKEEKYLNSKRSSPSKHTILQENNVCESKDQVSKLIRPKANKLNTSDLMKSTKKDKSTSLKKSKTNLENSFTVEDIPIVSTLSKTSSFNKSMLPPCPTSPETRLLLKEKLNDSLPALKLEKSGKRRKSALNFVVENDEEKTDDDKPIEINVSKKRINKVSEGKIQKKKHKMTTKSVQHGFNVENVYPPLEESSKLSKISDKNVEKKKKKVSKKNSSLNPAASVGKKNEKVEKKQKLAETKKNKEKLITIKEINQTSTEKMKKKTVNKKNNDVSENSLPKVTDVKPEKSLSVESILRTQSRVKRLPDDVIEGLFNIPVPPKKKRKLNQKVLPSRKMFDSEHPKPNNISIEEGGFIPLNSSGSTTSFYVTNLEKPKKSKKLAAVYSFRDRVLRRNPRQPVSAYLMYQQKLQALRNDKF